MTIYKIELVEGKEIFYVNPFPVSICVAGSVELVKDPDRCLVLNPGESLTINAPHMYIGTFPAVKEL